MHNPNNDITYHTEVIFREKKDAGSNWWNISVQKTEFSPKKKMTTRVLLIRLSRPSHDKFYSVITARYMSLHLFLLLITSGTSLSLPMACAAQFQSSAIARTMAVQPNLFFTKQGSRTFEIMGLIIVSSHEISYIESHRYVKLLSWKMVTITSHQNVELISW